MEKIKNILIILLTIIFSPIYIVSFLISICITISTISILSGWSDGKLYNEKEDEEG